jgi:hypothetical protein
VPRERSGLAYAAGFAALALIFSRFTFIPWLFAHRSHHIVDISQPDQAIAAIWFLVELPLPGLPAPFALWLGITAWQHLNRNPDQVGRVQAAIGITIGFLGTLIWLFESYQVARALWYF